MRNDKHPQGLWQVFQQAVRDSEDSWKALPQRLRGRGDWHLERGRIKDAELMFDAATEIENLRLICDAIDSKGAA